MTDEFETLRRATFLALVNGVQNGKIEPSADLRSAAESFVSMCINNPASVLESIRDKVRTDDADLSSVYEVVRSNSSAFEHILSTLPKRGEDPGKATSKTIEHSKIIARNEEPPSRQKHGFRALSKKLGAKHSSNSLFHHRMSGIGVSIESRQTSGDRQILGYSKSVTVTTTKKTRFVTVMRFSESQQGAATSPDRTPLIKASKKRKMLK